MNTLRAISFRLVLTLAAFSLLGGSAHAASITFQGTGKGESVTIHRPNGSEISVFAGELLWSGDLGTFYSYCVDVMNFVTSPQQVTVKSSNALVTPATDGGKKAAWLVETYAQTVHATGTAAQAAGLQLAIWEALYDNAPKVVSGMGAGTFWAASASSQALSAANTYLSALFSAPGGYYVSEARFLDAAVGQDQMVPNPEPASLLLLGTGIAAVAARRRKKTA